MYERRKRSNRFLDRDTLLVLTYDINFLYVLSSYVQCGGRSKSLDNFLRKRFRDDIVEAFETAYDFYCLSPRNGLTCEVFVEKHFRRLIGKKRPLHGLQNDKQSLLFC